MRAGLSALILFALCVHATAAAERQRIGRAFDRSTGELVYVETHQERLDDARVVAARVAYADASGRRFANKIVDFSDNPQMPAFRFENTATGHLEAVESGEDGRVVVFRESRSSTMRRTTIKTDARGIADAGFDRFIERNWDRLIREGSLVRPFLIPSRGEFIDFRVRHQSTATSEEATFVLEVDSALLRLLVPPLRVVYSRADRSLLRYTGISNVRDGAGDNYDVSIVFGNGTTSVARTGIGGKTSPASR